jgi:hypothetical protein
MCAANCTRRNRSSTAREFFPTQNKALDSSPTLYRCDDFRDISDRDVAVKEVIRFDENCDAAGTLIETACCTRSRLKSCEAACFQLFFQRRDDLVGTTPGAATFLMPVRSAVCAHEQILIALTHAHRLAAGALSVNHAAFLSQVASTQ